MKFFSGRMLLPLLVSACAATGNLQDGDRGVEGIDPSPKTIAQPNGQTNLGAAEAKSAERLRRARLEAVFIPTKSLAERQQEVRQELAARKGDPFARLPGTVVVTPPARPVLPPVSPSAPPSPRPVPSSVPLAVRSAPVRPAPVSVRPQPRPLPAATLKVTGVVDMGSDIYAIVSVPGDLTSQYVRPGQRLASGIYVEEVFAGAAPGVVVQQNGRRFVRYID